MTKIDSTERDQQIANLRKWLKPGDTVFTVLSSVSRSRMRREIRVLLIRPDRKAPGGVRILEPDYAVATVIGRKLAKQGDGIVMHGCGTDMGFEIVYSLGRALWPNGTPGAARDAAKRDGGYALNHRWL